VMKLWQMKYCYFQDRVRVVELNSAFNLELEAGGSIGQEKGVYMNGGHYA
jgi:hypothetical protein